MSMKRTEKLDMLMGALHAEPHGMSFVAGYLEGLVREFLTEDQIDMALAGLIKRTTKTEAEFTHEFHIAADQIEADGKRIEALSAENERLRMHLDVALETLAEEGVCGDECNTCKEARAALGKK